MADLPASWTMLRSRRIGGPDGPDVPYVLIHPEFGVALVDLVPPASAGAAFEAFLARERFAAFYPGHLSIVLVGIAPNEIPAAGDKLADAFEAAEPLTIADRDWADAVIELLLTPDARSSAGEAPVHRAEAVPPPAPPPTRPAAAMTAGPAAIRRTAVGKRAPAPRRRWPTIVLTAVLLALVAAVAITAALPLLDEQDSTTATSVPLPPTAQATAPVPPSVAETAPPTVAPSTAPPVSSAQAEAPPQPPMPVAAALPMIAPPIAPLALSRVAPLPLPPAPITAGLPMIPPPASSFALSRVEPLPAPLPARKPPTIAEARPGAATASGTRRERSRKVASTMPPRPPASAAARRVRPPAERRDLPPIDAADLPPLDGPVTPPPAETAGSSGVPNTPPPQQQAVNTVAPPPPPKTEERPREAPTVGLPVPLLPPAVSGSTTPRPGAAPSPVVDASGGGQTCQPYRADATVTGLPEPVRGLACRDADGHWQIVSEVPDR